MKKWILLVFAFGSFVAASAQDVIVRGDGTRIESRVVEITPDEVRYKRFSNPDGPTYVLPVSEVSRIVYPNGETDEFTPAKKIEAPAPRPAALVQTPQPLPVYSMGDYYDDGTVRGIVARLPNGVTHGLILSLDELYLPWSTFRKPDLRAVGAVDSVDGEVNMQAVERYITGNGLSWSDFPAFQWCRERGEGWYLPAIDEMLHICANYNGGTRANSKSGSDARNRFNKALRERGGMRMDRMAFYFSSTERDEKSAIATHTTLEPPFLTDLPKTTKFLVRAVHKF